MCYSSKYITASKDYVHYVDTFFCYLFVYILPSFFSKKNSYKVSRFISYRLLRIVYRIVWEVNRYTPNVNTNSTQS